MKWKYKTIKECIGGSLSSDVVQVARVVNHNAYLLREAVQKIEELSEEIEMLKKKLEKEDTNEKKYKLTNNVKELYGKKLYQIQALKSFGDVLEGDLGGYIEDETNLSQECNAWVYDNACVADNARIAGNAIIRDDAVIRDNVMVYDAAKIFNNAVVYGNAKVYNNARVYGYAHVYGNAKIFDVAKVYDNAKIHDNANVFSNSHVHGNSNVCGNACICGCAELKDNTKVWDDAFIMGDSVIHSYACICGEALITSIEDYSIIIGFGLWQRPTTFFRCKDDKIYVNCGCFQGTIDDFRKQVKKTRTGKIAEEYLLIADLMEKHFTRERNKKWQLEYIL